MFTYLDQAEHYIILTSQLQCVHVHWSHHRTCNIRHMAARVLTGRKTCLICLISYNLSHSDITELTLSVQTTNGLIYDHPLALI